MNCHGDAVEADPRKGPPLLAKAGSTMSLSSYDDSWAECFSLESLNMLDINDGNGWDWELSGVHEPEPHAVTSVKAAVEGPFKELSVPMEVETTTHQETWKSTPGVSRPPVAEPEVHAIEDSEIPVFTAQDEIDERATLTTSEIERIISDLHGITTGVANLSTEKSTSPSPGPTTLLSLLDDEISKLPKEQRATYCQAVLKCPGLVSDGRKMAFLNRENGDAALAAMRLACYWELRLETFGPERCFLPMTLEGAMKGEVENMVRWPIHQLLPVKDTAGRAIVLFYPSRRDLDEYSIEQELMQFWYLFEVLMEDPEVLKRGFVLLTTAKNVEMKHMKPKGQSFNEPGKRMMHILDEAMPIEGRASHFCQPTMFLYCVLPVVMQFVGRHHRRRLQLHRGSEAKTLRDLEGFGLPRDRLPTELGGEVVLDMATFLANRMILERTRADPRLVLDPKPTGVATKRVRNEAVITVHQGVPEKSHKKRRGRGRPSDPRMDEAIKIRLANPKSPVICALVAAGFTFELTDEAGEPMGSDNITLAQRKNNLSRRVRQEKLKLAEETQHDNEQNCINTTNARSEIDHGLASEATVDYNMVEEDDMDENASQCSNISGESRDSFYEAILELPGMKGRVRAANKNIGAPRAV